MSEKEGERRGSVEESKIESDNFRGGSKGKSYYLEVI